MDTVLIDADGVVVQVWRNTAKKALGDSQPGLKASRLVETKPGSVHAGYHQTSGGTFAAPPLLPVKPGEAIKAECARRIVAVAKDLTTQGNIAAHMLQILAQGSKLSADDKKELAEATGLLDWIKAMREQCRTLVADRASNYQDDAAWPPAPDGARAFADRF